MSIIGIGFSPTNLDFVHSTCPDTNGNHLLVSQLPAIRQHDKGKKLTSIFQTLGWLAIVGRFYRVFTSYTRNPDHKLLRDRPGKSNWKWYLERSVVQGRAKGTRRHNDLYYIPDDSWQNLRVFSQLSFFPVSCPWLPSPESLAEDKKFPSTLPWESKLTCFSQVSRTSLSFNKSSNFERVYSRPGMKEARANIFHVTLNWDIEL